LRAAKAVFGALVVLVVLSKLCDAAGPENNPTAGPSNIKAQFDALYEAYLEAPPAPPYSSVSASREAISQLQKIRQLGAAITPSLMQKLKQTSDINLLLPISVLTKKRFKDDEWPGGIKRGSRAKVQMYIDWWDTQASKTPQRFDKLYAEWKALKSNPAPTLLATTKYLYDDAQKRMVEVHQRTRAGKALDSIKMLGIAALPCMMERIGDGDYDMLPLVEELTDGATRAPGRASERARFCLAWWEENKQNWIIPFPDSDLARN